MFNVKKLTLLLGGILALSSCASMYHGKNGSFADFEIKPVMKVKHASGSAKIWYLLGRYYQGKMKYKKAITAYEMALTKNPHYVEAHNGLGVIYAAQGNHESALRYFHKAVELAPRTAYLHNNLGYAYLIQRQENKAVDSLKRALQLDPDNKSARINLTTATERLARDNNLPQQMLAEPESPIPSPAADVDNREKQASDKKIPKIELSNIEVSNGNGVLGMAKQVSDFFRQLGFSRARLTNYQTFQQEHTRIYYRPGYLQQAEYVNQLLPIQVRAIESNGLRSDVQVKILLGRDFSEKVSFFNANKKIKIAYEENVIVVSRSAK